MIEKVFYLPALKHSNTDNLRHLQFCHVDLQAIGYTVDKESRILLRKARLSMLEFFEAPEENNNHLLSLSSTKKFEILLILQTII